VEVLEERGDALRGIPDGSLDLALALDVLEHVPDLDHTVGELLRVVRPGGELIVTGPTENLFYKIGRRVAGPAYSGDYHVRDVMSIEAAMRRRARTQRLATLIPGVPLFRVLVAHREAV
jgi:SAM-dependent methyltransferase